MNAGYLSAIPFHTRRPASYPSSTGRSTEPRIVAAHASTAVAAMDVPLRIAMLSSCLTILNEIAKTSVLGMDCDIHEESTHLPTQLPAPVRCSPAPSGVV
jgi:hypothetical protein